MSFLQWRADSTDDPFTAYQGAIAEANLYLMKKVTFGACINMTVLSVISPFLGGFEAAEWLYVICAVLTGLLALHCYCCKSVRGVLPLFYALMGGLCGYAIALSSFFYPDIHGVTIVAIFVLVPILILDRTWRIHAVFTLLFAVSCALAFWRKPLSIAVDDCTTCGAFLVFGMLIGNYLRKTRVNAIIQQHQTERQRDYDMLTGLPNRRLLFETLGKIDSGDDPAPLSGVFMIDIDDFKKFNDVNGHQVGDVCLRALGTLLQQFAVQNGCKIFRYGGEEFIAIWQSKQLVDLVPLADRLIDEVQHSAYIDGNVTISLGYALRQENVSSQRLISMADSALYDAKRLGKNRAVCYSQPDPHGDAASSYRQRI